MSRDQERILESVHRGELSADEAHTLLEAMRRPRPPLWRRLLLPLEHMSSGAALGIACGVAAVSLGLSRLHLRFDGTLDTHLGSAPVAPLVAVLDLLVSWPLTALVFWAASRGFARRGRYVDHLSSVGVARIPVMLSALVLLAVNPLLPPMPPPGSDPLQIDVAAWAVPGLLLAAGTMPFLVLFIALLVTGFRTVSGLRGARLAGVFIGALVAAEVLSKLVLYAAGRALS